MPSETCFSFLVGGVPRPILWTYFGLLLGSLVLVAQPGMPSMHMLHTLFVAVQLQQENASPTA